MREYKVVLETTGTETYYVMANSEEEARDNWHMAEEEPQVEVFDYHVKSVTLEEIYEED